MKYILLLSFVFMFLSVPSGYADDADVAPTVKEITKSLYDSLDEEQRSKFARILAAHGIISSTTHTMKILRTAVKSCSKNQPDLKPEIKNTFIKFEKEINPILSKASGAFRRTLKLGEVLSYKDMKRYLKKLDEEALKEHKKTEIIPATRLDDCTRFLSKIKEEVETSRLKDTLNKSFGFEVKD